jgi:tetratricopeptide (TPR) repeat protein
MMKLINCWLLGSCLLLPISGCQVEDLAAPETVEQKADQARTNSTFDHTEGEMAKSEMTKSDRKSVSEDRESSALNIDHKLTEQEISKLSEEFDSHLKTIHEALKQQDIQQARSAYADLEEVGITLGESVNDFYFACVLEVHGAIEIGAGNLEEALESLEAAFQIALEAEVADLSLAILASELGHCYRLNGKFEEAADILDSALSDLEEHDDDHERQMSVVAELYECHIKLKSPELAIEAIERGLAILLPHVEQEYDRIAMMSGLAAELCQLIGDETRFQEFAQLCQSLDQDFKLQAEIREGLVQAKVFSKSTSFADFMGELADSQGGTITSNSSVDQNQLALAQAEYEQALQRFDTAQRNWNSEQQRWRTTVKLANQNAGRMGALGAGPAHFIYDMDADPYLQQEFHNAQRDLERAKAKLQQLTR